MARIKMSLKWTARGFIYINHQQHQGWTYVEYYEERTCHCYSVFMTYKKFNKRKESAMSCNSYSTHTPSLGTYNNCGRQWSSSATACTSHVYVPTSWPTTGHFFFNFDLSKCHFQLQIHKALSLNHKKNTILQLDFIIKILFFPYLP